MFKSKSRALFTAIMLLVMLTPGLGGNAAAAPVGATGRSPLQGAGLATAQSVSTSAQMAQSWAEWLKRNNIDEATYGSDPNSPSTRGVMPYDGGPILGPMPPYPGAVVVPPCDTPGATVKTFNISAIDVVITINRFGDNNPQGKMYVLDENIPAVRAQEQQVQADIDQGMLGGVSVTPGLRDDPIQPLVIRANIGECVVINFTNRLALGRASMNVRGLGVAVEFQGANVGLNPDTLVDPGDSITYKWNIPDGGLSGPDPLKMEGSYVFSSLGNPRQQQAHGLFGVINVERRGSTYLNPNTGLPQKSGWEAIIVDPNGKDFREDTIMYHEFGDETFRLREANGGNMPLVDDLGVYRPGSRLLNYRSEPFFRRMELDINSPRLGQADESQSYGSYMHGDPATPFPRGYIGDPTKRRIVHPGSERFHSEHLHGGSIRWPFDPFVEPDKWGSGLDKHPQGQFLSQRLDVQAVGPGETYTEQMEAAAGGLQAGPGEYLFHCHFPQHYIGGMWAFWRVFDTLQTTATTQPGQPPLVELPDRAGLTPLAVTSVALLGTALPSGKTLTASATTATSKNIDEWMRSVLPPQGAHNDYTSPNAKFDYDASVWDWTVQNDAQGRPIYLSEPDDTTTWVNWKGEWASGDTQDHRRKIMFNPRNGRPAFPLLRPHLATRPPFAPGRSGSPYLGEPDADHPDSLIPSDARRIQYTVVAKPMPIIFNNGPDGIAGTGDDLADPAGLLMVLDEDKDAILSGQKPKEQLTLRANVGDGVDVTYYSEEPSELDLPEGPAMAKTNMHIHFVQFDTQASDGVISGMSYEQSVRPYAAEGGATRDVAGPGIRLTQTANAGSSTITVDNASTLKVNAFVGIGFGVATNQPNGFEFAQIRAKTGNTLTLDRQLQKAHPAGQFAGTEFVRYQWYADIEDGTTFYHDHVFGIPGFGKALTGVLIQEPRDSLWLDPKTGNPIRSGSQAIIQTDRQVAPGVPIQSFREFALHSMGAITALDEKGVSKGEPGGFNMRTEPLSFRLQNNSDPSLVFSSAVHGDPATPVLRAYVGDLVALRMIQTSGHDAVGFHLAGHRFRLERFDPREEPKDGLTMVIAERFDLFFTAGSVGLQPGDYVYMNPMQEKTQDGAWGILRVHDTLQNDLLPIRAPNPAVGAGFPPASPCLQGGRPCAASEPQTLVEFATKLGRPEVASMPVREFNVNAIEVPIIFDEGGDSELRVDDGRAYVLAEDEAAIRNGTKPLEPLVLRANVGEVVRVNFTNKLPNARASFHIPQTIQTADSLGSAFGFNKDSTVGPGQSITQYFVIDSRFEVPRSFNITDYGEPVSGPVEGHYSSGAAKGLYGAFIIEPAGSTFHNPVTGAQVKSGVVVDVRNASLPGGGFRDIALIFQDDDQNMNRDVMPYRAEVRGLRGINYKALPVKERKDEGVADDDVFKNRTQNDDPRTTLIQATSGDPVRLHVIGGPGHQPHVFSLDGHRFPFDPGRPDLMKFASRLFGPMTTIDAALDGGAGGGMCTPGGDFMYNDRRGPFLESGLWGIMRVAPPSQATVLPLEAAMVPGWNLVSRHLVPDNTSPSQFLSSIAGKFNLVAALDPNDPTRWQTFNPSVTQNTLTSLDHTKGFWVHMTQPGFLAPAGTLPVETTINLKAGWNLMGWPSHRTMPVVQALASIAGKFDLVFAYDASDTADPWKRYDPAAPVWANDLVNIQPLYGYWVHMKQAGTLTVVNQ